MFFRLSSLELGLIVFGIVLGTTVLGVFLGHRLRAHAETLREPFGVVQAALLGLVGLILAFGLMQLVWGPVADRVGRRPVLLASLSLMVLASVGATFADDIGTLIAWRTAQGATLAAEAPSGRQENTTSGRVDLTSSRLLSTAAPAGRRPRNWG